MLRFGKVFASAVISVSLIGSSTAALAQTAPAPTSDAWLTLSMLTPSGSAALGSTAAVAAQPSDVPPPPPPADYAGPSTPPLAVILVWLATLGVDVYLLTKNNHHHHHNNSPA